MFSHNEPPCIFCKKKTQQKIKQMTMVRQFQACETIVQTATVKGDEDKLRVTGAVNNDLVAAEARSHKACHATYISKNNLHYEGRQDIHKDIHTYVSPPSTFTGQLRRAPIMYNGLYTFSVQAI